MKPFYLLTFILFLSVTTLWSQESTAINFPNDYFGIYTGQLQINSEKGTQEIPMEFHLLATDTLGKYTYNLVYGANDERQVRSYNLIEKDKEKGNYVVDENNGILLDDKVIGNRMYALFEVNNSLLTTFITFEKDHMVFEIAFSNKEKKRTSYAENEDETEVISYPISVVQRAVLYKQ